MGDPWGGWAFGSRYLVPSYAIMSIFIAVALNIYKKSEVFILLFFVIMLYSVIVNTLGAVTTNTNPPKSEAEAIEAKYKIDVKYTYERNFEYLMRYGSKSFVYQAYARNYLSGWQFFFLISSSIVSILTLQIFYLYVFEDTFVLESISKRLKALINTKEFKGKPLEKLRALED